MSTIEYEATIEQLNAADRAWESNCRALDNGPALFRLFGITRQSFTAGYLASVFGVGEL